MINARELDLSTIEDETLKAIIICLFTDAKVDDAELPSYLDHNAGWWGDAFELTIGGNKKAVSLGSKLWTLKREKIESGLDKTIADFALEALTPLIDAKIITTPEITSVISGNQSRLTLKFADRTIDFEGILP